jgi:hypothetical protein
MSRWLVRSWQTAFLWGPVGRKDYNKLNFHASRHAEGSQEVEQRRTIYFNPEELGLRILLQDFRHGGLEIRGVYETGASSTGRKR